VRSVAGAAHDAAMIPSNGREMGRVYLARSDRGERVFDTRRAYQDAMSSEWIASIEDLAGRTVLTSMSANHVDPDDFAAEVPC
jgi:hypothetical protein